MAYTPVLTPMRRALWLIVFVSLSSKVAAQTLPGGLVSTIQDEQGLAIAGAHVRLSSPSLIGGTVTATTSERGQVRFPGLPAGPYDLEVTMTGFAPYRATTIDIGTATVDYDVVLRLASQTTAVTVVGSARDTRNPGFNTAIGSEQLADTPTRRNGMFAFIGAAPGISTTSTQASAFVSAFGSGVDQNAFLVDGTNVTATSNGVARSEPGIDFIQEMHVQSVGASAEYGNVQGAVIEVITRQGSDRFLGDASYYGQPAILTSQPITRPVDGVGPAVSGYERRKYIDTSTTFGGPALRGRLWFFGGYQYVRDEDSQPGADPFYPKQYAQDKVFGKLTWGLAPGWQLVQSFHGEYWDNRELPTATKRVEATQRLQASVPAVTLGRLTHVSSSNRVWEASAGWFDFSQDISRVTGDPTTPGLLNRSTGVMSGAPAQIGEVGQTRWTGKATMNQYLPAWAGADHDLRVGAQFEWGEHRALLVVPTGVRYEESPARRISSDVTNAGGRFVTASLFVTDAIAVRDRLTITGGLRFDHSRAISPDVPRRLADGSDTGETIDGVGLLYTWNVLSPRLGVALQLTSDGRTILRGSYGRFSQGILTGELSGNHPGLSATKTEAIDPATGEYATISVVDPRTNVRIDPHTRAPRTDAYSLGVDRELGRTLSAGVVYVRKNGSDFIGWDDVGGQYRTETRTVDGQPLDVSILTSSPNARLFEISNPPGYSLRYDGVALTLEKRRSRGWQASGSYTWSRASGLQPSGGTTAAGAQVATVGAPPVSFSPPVTFGRDPNSLTNADGRLPNDRPHLVTFTGSADVPKVGISVAANFQYASGKPWAETADLNLVASGQGTVRVLLEPRGTRRLSSQQLLDVRIAKPFALGRNSQVELRADVLNILNDTAEESIASDRFDSTSLGEGNVFLDPRRVLLSVKVSFGR